MEIIFVVICCASAMAADYTDVTTNVTVTTATTMTSSTEKPTGVYWQDTGIHVWNEIWKERWSEANRQNKTPLYIAAMFALSHSYYAKYGEGMLHIVQEAFEQIADRDDILPGYHLRLLPYSTQVSVCRPSVLNTIQTAYNQ